jgi:hypothetical protein
MQNMSDCVECGLIFKFHRVLFAKWRDIRTNGRRIAVLLIQIQIFLKIVNVVLEYLRKTSYIHGAQAPKRVSVSDEFMLLLCHIAFVGLLHSNWNLS